MMIAYARGMTRRHGFKAIDVSALWVSGILARRLVSIGDPAACCLSLWDLSGSWGGVG